MNAQSDAGWKTLYRVGGIAPLLTIVFYLVEMIALGAAAYPPDMEAWYRLFDQSRLLGLFYLNALDIVSIALQAPFFLALSVAIWRADRSWALLVAGIALVGVSIFVGPRSVSMATLTLSEQYVAAGDAPASHARQAQLLAAGEALHAQLQATPHTVGFALLAVAALIVSRVMWTGADEIAGDTGPPALCSRMTAVLGLLAGALALIGDLFLVVWPVLATPLMIASGIVWLLWWGRAGMWLLQRAHYAGKASNA